MQRGEVYRFKVPKGVGHEQRGERFGVVVQIESHQPVMVAGIGVGRSGECCRAALSQVLFDHLTHERDRPAQHID